MADFETKDLEVPDVIIEKWQKLVDTLAKLVKVPSGLIMRVKPPYMEVFRSSQTNRNPYKTGDREHLAGLYCEKVIETRKRLCIPNALEHPDWCHNPDIKLGMISYLGYPIIWPDGDIFGTICILDNKAHDYNEQTQTLMLQFRELLESHLALIHQASELSKRNEELSKALAEVKSLQGLLPICAWCKKVRDDQGYWHSVENYILSHSNAELTHGMCPECASKNEQED